MQVDASASIHGKAGPAVATGGALLFVASLLYGVWSYAWRFGIEAPAASIASHVSAAAIDVALFTAFAFHHSLFARAPLRRTFLRA